MSQGADDPFPWDRLIAFGLGRLRLDPKSFWALSLPELRALLGTTLPADLRPIGRAQLETLLKRYPDGGADGR